MRTFFRHLTSLYLATSLFAWLPASAHGTVLCFEPDGTVCIEVGSACCRTSPASDPRELSTSDAASDPCGPCADLQLGGHAGRPASGTASVPAPSLTASWLPSGVLAPPPPRACLAAAADAAPPSPRPGLLRSTILRN